jgi:hemerythrin-like domain-containing protein
MTRAERILQHIYEIAPILIASGIGAVVGAANIAHQMHQAKKRTAEKVQQAGMGVEHQQAKQNLHSLQKTRVKHLGLASQGMKDKIQASKAHVKHIENTGLQKYHQGLAQNPQNHVQAKQTELTTQHPG